MELSAKEIQVGICYAYAIDILNVIPEETLKGNLDSLCVYLSMRFVETYPMIHDNLPNTLVLKYFDSYLNERIDDILKFIQLVNSAVLLYEGEA